MAGSQTLSNDPLNQALARVAELESALRASEEAAKTSAQELQHFVYAASHDLQEPLRAIRTYTQLLQRLNGNDPQAADFANFITTGVDRMHALLHNLLTYSRVNQNPVLHNCHLGAALQSALYRLSPVIKETGATVRHADLPELPAYEAQISQLFEQLLSNAILYRSAKAPEVEILFDETEVDGGPALVVKVKDNGVGIEPQYLSLVVQPFKRLHGKEYPGNGLGLAICNKIMRAHKGKLWLESDGENGTAVFLAFPY